ncbi:MAG: alpha-glucosidase C-terminal domain-containing protein, partial [Spirochaetes bacterium]|nr:alpha-glucosidase C-terminal domain-containing protein [Spirochaetota bacterium]
KKYKAFGRGGINFLTPRNAKVLSFIREYENEFILVVINLSRFSQVVELDLSKYIGYIPEEVFSHNRFPVIKDTSYTITLCPYNYYWFLLKKEKGAIDLKKESDISCIYVISDLNELFMGKPREKLEQEIFVEYFKRCRWFGGKARTICKISIIENSSIYKKYPFAHLLILEVDYNDGPSEKYLLPLFFESRNKGISIKKQFPQAIIAQIKIGEEEGILYDGVYSEKFHHFLFEMIVKRKKLRGINGEFIAFNGKKLKNFFIDKQFPIKSHVLKTEQSNTSIIYEDTFILKLFRKLEYGANPDTEILRELTDHSRFSQVPKFCGAVEYKMQSLEFISAGLLENYVPNVGDGWTYTLDNVSQYFDRILSKKFEITKEPQITSFNIEKDSSEEYLFLRGFIGEFFLEMITLLGQRTGELHLSLFNISGNPDFEPEPFSTLYQRSIYQSMRNLVKQTFRILKTNTENFSNNLKKEIIHTLESEENILKRLGRILEKNISSMKIRIHGDYHLGQVLFTGKDFVI